MLKTNLSKKAYLPSFKNHRFFFLARVKSKALKLFASIGGTSTLSLASVLLSMVLYNTDSVKFTSLAECPVVFGLGDYLFIMSVQDIFTQFLLTAFFLLVTLELKQEYVDGDSSARKSAGLSLIASCGGMIVPAAIYLFYNYGTDAHNGWAIPISTDTAFVVCFFTLIRMVGSTPIYLFSISLAVIDDLVSIFAMTLLSDHYIKTNVLLWTIIPLLLLVYGNKYHTRTRGLYLVAGTVLWLLLYISGIHPTLAGVILGFSLPFEAVVGGDRCVRMIRNQNNRYYYNTTNSIKQSQDNHRCAQQTSEHLAHLKALINSSVSVSQQAISSFTWLVGFIVLPGFAFVNSGICFSAEVIQEAILSPVSQGIFLGLFIGKPIGIFLFSVLAIKSGAGVLPRGLRLYDVLGAGIISGMGYTVSILTTSEIFKGNTNVIQVAKISIIASAMVTSLLGLMWAWGKSVGSGVRMHDGTP